MEEKLFIYHNSISNLIESKRYWKEYFNSAKIEYVDIEEEYGIDFFNDLMPDFYFPQIDFVSGKKSEAFFASLNYAPTFKDLESQYSFPFHTYMDLLNPMWKDVKYVDFLVKNKKSILFLNEYVEFKPTTVLRFDELDNSYSASLGIPFAYLMKESYGNIWYGDEDLTEHYLKLELTK